MKDYQSKEVQQKAVFIAQVASFSHIFILHEKVNCVAVF